jgi:hypothetical protein
MESLQPHIIKFENAYSNKLLYTINFTHVTFAGKWNGRYYVMAVDYESYVILKGCPFNTNERKYVPCEWYKYVTK